MNVSAQNVWPSLKYDVKAANGLVGRFLSAGFYYKTFMKPAALWPRYEHVLAKFAPGGTVDLDTPHGRYDKRYAHPDVVVAGGGPAGMAAAIAAAEIDADGRFNLPDVIARRGTIRIGEQVHEVDVDVGGVTRVELP